MASGFSKYDRKEITQSLYCYPDTDIFKNKAGIKDAKALADFEADVTAIRQYMLENQPIKGKFGTIHLKNIHKFIFQDVYKFAGKLQMRFCRFFLYCIFTIQPSIGFLSGGQILS